KPFVSITHNCLDGNFAYPGWNGLGETLLRMGEASTGNALYRNTGSAAHFGSTGLGLLQHHKLVSDSLMEGFLEKGLVTIGDGVNYAKVKYLAYAEENLTIPTAELFSYNLLGDPAMVLFKANQSGISSSVSKTSVEPNDDVLFTFEIDNNSKFTAAANTSFSFTIPADFEYDGIVIDYSGPNSDQFNNPANFTLEPVTVSNTTDSSGNTEITVTTKKDLDNDQIATGGIPAEGSIRIRIYTTAKSELTSSVVYADYALKTPGATAAEAILLINTGGVSFIYLPLISRN
ncbi:MAG: C25 family cysteine peptidase, partial [Chloroflexota bacterium]